MVATGLPAYALTNWSAETFHHARRQFSFLAEFTAVLVSGELRLVKPDPAIYAELLRRTGTRPEETFFTDDSARNVAAAGAAGLDAVVYTDADRLRHQGHPRRVKTDGASSSSRASSHAPSGSRSTVKSAENASWLHQPSGWGGPARSMR